MLCFVLLSACRETQHTEWEYNNPRNGGFQKVPFYEQECPAGMVLIKNAANESNSSTSDSVWANDFFISKYEETNGQYLVYLNWLQKYYSHSTYLKALPYTNVWNEFLEDEVLGNYLSKNYFGNSAYYDFPVVGLTPKQINNYADWKTDRINEFIMIREEILQYNLDAKDSSELFTTAGYLSNEYDPYKSKLIDINPAGKWKKNEIKRKVRWEDGILLPRLRLPTFDEWHQAHFTDNVIETSAPLKVKKKYDKLKLFFYLNDVKDLAKNRKEEVYIMPKVLFKVYKNSSAIKHICALDSNAAEIVRHQYSFGVVGMSDNKTSQSNESEIKVSMKIEAKLDSSQTGFYGFRLAMDRLGPPFELGTYR